MIERKQNKTVPKGVYDFMIISLDTEYIGKTGNKSIRLVIDVDYLGESYKIYEYFTKKLDPKTEKPYAFVRQKLSDLLESIGKKHLIGKEIINGDNLLGSVGKAIIIEMSSDNYGIQNKILKFVTECDNYDKEPEIPMPKQEHVIEEKENEDVPF